MGQVGVDVEKEESLLTIHELSPTEKKSPSKREKRLVQEIGK